MTMARVPPPESTEPVSRRDFLVAGGLAAAGAGFPNLVGPAAAAEAASTALAAPAGARRAIVIFLVGGASHIDTFDPKPDAPRETRTIDGAVSTSVPGVALSEHLPRLAARLDRVALVRSLHHDCAPIHETGQQLMLTGRCCTARTRFPHIGAALASLAGAERRVPASVILPGAIGFTGVDASHGQDRGFLDAAFEPPHLHPDSVDLSAELPALRARYGESIFGRSCLAARRLIEQGVAMCTVNSRPEIFHSVSWDMHANGGSLNSTIADYRHTLCPELDAGLAALLDDLDERGLLAETLVAVVSEMGRSPRINERGGRDHSPGVWTGLLAGAGIPGGAVVGASDRCGAVPADRPVTPAEFVATIWHALGVDAAAVHYPAPAESLPLCDAGPIRELTG